MVPRPVATPSPPLVLFLSTTSALGPSMSILIIIPTHDHALRCPCPSMPPPRCHGVRSRPLACPSDPCRRHRHGNTGFGVVLLSPLPCTSRVRLHFLGCLNTSAYLITSWGTSERYSGTFPAHFPRKARPGAAPGTSQGRRPAMQGPYWTLIPHRSARRPERHEATAPLPPLFNTLRP